MKEIKGTLQYISLWSPILLYDDNSNIDLRDEFFPFFEKLNGVKSEIDYSKSSFEIGADENSDRVFEFVNDTFHDTMRILLKNTDHFGFTNIGVYLPNALQLLNGRKVIITITDTKLSIIADPDDKVYGLYFTDGNSCKIPEGDETTICKIGTTDCCIFCTAGSKGFECQKFNSPTARLVLGRHGKKEMNASRIGNCELLGRKDDE